MIASKRFFFPPACLQQAGEIIIREKDTQETTGSERMGSFKKVFTTPAVHLLAFFIFFYTGAEVTIGGMVLAVVIMTFFSYAYNLA